MTLNFQSVKSYETTEEFRQSICANLNTSLDQLEKDVQKLKDWIKSQPHLPQSSSDTMLKAYLIAFKNKMEKVKSKLESYYTARAELPDIFSDRDPTDQKIIENGEAIEIFSLPKLTPDGCRVNICSHMTSDANKFNAKAFKKRIIMVEDMKMNMEPFINGEYYVFDGTKLTMGHILKTSPSLCRDLIHCGQNALPIRVKGVIFINAPSYVEVILNLIRPFMTSKLFQRVHAFSGGAEALEKYFPISILPKELGGEEVSRHELNESWMKCLRDNREWFLKESEIKADVNKNKVNPVKRDQFEQVQGSFKQLNID